MNLKDQLDALLDATAYDSTGVKIGAVRQLYVDDASGKITFATVSTGIFSADAIVPLHGARLIDDELHIDHTRAVVRDSPRPDGTEDALTPDKEIRLLEYYGIEPPTAHTLARETAAPHTPARDNPGPGATGKAPAPGAPEKRAAPKTDAAEKKPGKSVPAVEKHAEPSPTGKEMEQKGRGPLSGKAQEDGDSPVRD